jgi:ferredoxin
MKASVDHDLCIGCELCTDICPSVFEMGDDGFSHVIVDPIPAEDEECTIEAEDSCPSSAISHEG